MESEDIREEVRKIITRDIKKFIFEYEDNLEEKIKNEIPNYDLEWSLGEDNNSFFYKNSMEDAIKYFVAAELTNLFENKK